MAKVKAKPEAIGDASNLPLQIRTAELIKSSERWKVYLEEQPWKSPFNESGGYIDIVARHNVSADWYLVIECKRVKQATWMFYIPEKEIEKQVNTRIWTTKFQRHYNKFGFNNQLKRLPIRKKT